VIFTVPNRKSGN